MFKIICRLLYLTCMTILLQGYLHHKCTRGLQSQRGCWTSWNWSYGWKALLQLISRGWTDGSVVNSASGLHSFGAAHNHL